MHDRKYHAQLAKAVSFEEIFDLTAEVCPYLLLLIFEYCCHLFPILDALLDEIALIHCRSFSVVLQRSRRD